MIAEGKISIDVAMGTNKSVTIQSNRGVNIADLLRGKKSSEAPVLLPMLFSVCGMAHASAAAQACSSFGGQSKQANNTQKIAREMVVLCENAREHCLRVFTGWGADNPEAITAIPFNEIMALPQEMRKIVSGADGVFSLNGAIKLDVSAARSLVENFEAFLSKFVFGDEINRWLAVEADDDLQKWAQSNSTIAGKFIAELYTNDWQSIGVVTPNFLTEIEVKPLREALHEDNDFTSQPLWDGKPLETGPLSRWHETKIIQCLSRKYGAGLLVRHIARLVELAQIPIQLTALIQAYEARSQSKAIDAQLQGIGIVETARGRLVHSVKIRGGRIYDYKILAPTEWNFHPHGVAVQSLLAINDNEYYLEQAQMIIEAIDPCVAFEVRQVKHGVA